MIAKRSFPHLKLVTALALATFATAALSGCKGSSDSEGSRKGGGLAKGQPPATSASVKETCDDVTLCLMECNAGRAESCRRLGATYVRGANDGGRNEALGRRYFDLSCERGSAQGCISAGEMYENGQGVPKNLAQAAKAYAYACKLGGQEGCARAALGRGADAGP